MLGISIVLGIIAEALIGALAEHLTGDLYEELKGDPARQAFKQALGAALQRFATGPRLALARPLMQKDSPLGHPEVAKELAHILRFDREPNYELIGKHWRDALENPPRWRDFGRDAKSLVDYLENELRASDVFRPVFEAQDLSAIAADAEQSAESLANIERQLKGLVALLDAHFGELLGAFLRSTISIRDQIRDFNGYVEEKTRGFVGRQWVFDRVNRFFEENPRGYFFIIGDPGIGKSALAAQMVKENGYVHHFNIRAEGINKPATFLKNVCAQLIATYDLEHSVLPPEVTDDAGFLNKLLSEVSQKLAPSERCVIVVDALDETDSIGIPSSVNLLYLPLTVPHGVYLVVTMREEDERKIKPRVECEQDELWIGHDSANNLADITDFVRAATARSGIQAYILAQRIERQDFVTLIVTKSEGNFMYLRYVLPEIERGAYQDLNLDAVPVGLKGYYEEHWQRMKGVDRNAWFEYKLPVIVALTVVLEPVSIDLISDFSRVEDRRRIRGVLRDWAPFLHDMEVEYEGGRQSRYRLYHASFFDFIAAKQEVADEHVDLKAMHGQIADTLWEDLFGEE